MSAFLEIPSFIFSLVGKFSAAFLLFAGVILVLPDDIAVSMAILEFRKQNLASIWLFFLLSASVFVSYLGKAIWSAIYPAVVSKLGKRKRQRLNLERLKSLSDRENLWITCCLYYNRQSMNAPVTAQPPSALRSKGLLELGQGHMLDATYTIPDDLWRHLQSVRDDYVPKNMSPREQSEFVRRLERYRESLQPY
jgi:hypothetical protein